MNETELLLDSIKRNDFKKVEWSMGNGQCPSCYGNKPNAGWWTDTVGHKNGCLLADLMKKSGHEVIYQHKNPERCIGFYDPLKGKKGNHILQMIRANDPDREQKLKELGL